MGVVSMLANCSVMAQHLLITKTETPPSRLARPACQLGWQSWHAASKLTRVWANLAFVGPTDEILRSAPDFLFVYMSTCRRVQKLLSGVVVTTSVQLDSSEGFFRAA